MTVWLIYTLDHLLDARILQKGSPKFSYRWHWENRKILWPMLLAGVIATIVMSLLLLPFRILVFGGIVGGGVGGYILIHRGMPCVRRRYVFKEGWISLIYTSGVWGVPLIYHGKIPEFTVLLAILIYLMLVLINVLIYSYHEVGADLHLSQETLATVAGLETTRHLLRLLVLSVLILIMAAFFVLDDAGLYPVFLILLGMTAVLGMIIYLPRFFNLPERYGILADAVFLLPGLLYWVP
jgi:4-hydroxybenzoate polyprenyltransferase